MNDATNIRHAISIARAPKGTPISKRYHVLVGDTVVAYESSRSNALDTAATCRRSLEAVGLDVALTIDNTGDRV